MVIKFYIPASELECTYARSSGPGGQNVNKVNSKCILRWPVAASTGLPSEVRSRFLARYANRLTQDGVLVIMSDRYRDQKRNYEDCLAKAQAMVDAVTFPPKKRVQTQPTRGSQRRRRETKRVHSQKKAARRKMED